MAALVELAEGSSWALGVILGGDESFEYIESRRHNFSPTLNCPIAMSMVKDGPRHTLPSWLVRRFSCQLGWAGFYSCFDEAEAG